MIKITQSTDGWKEIEGFSRYRINKHGKILNLNSGKVISGHINKRGYIQYSLWDDDNKVCKRMAHILVATAFIPNDNPKEKIYVNHKDENKANPCVDNLEWVTPKENTNYGTCKERIGEANSYPINEYDIQGKYIRTWKSAKYPADIYSVTPRLIQSACVGKTVTAYGRQWRYLKFDDTSNIVPVKNKFALKYNKNANHDVIIPGEYLYEVRKLTEAERYAEMLEEMICNVSTPKCYLCDLKKVHDYLLQA